ncbi:MAG: GIY-YIG nuclease family protein [Chloroflexota bacterium]
MKGTYLLILYLADEIAALNVGRLGAFTFAAGYYLYVGSAFGPGGVNARLAYHQRRTKQRPRWHIDYLRERARLLEAWAIGWDVPIERPLVSALLEDGRLCAPVPGFGAGDSDLRSHLLYSAKRPPERSLTTAILAIAEASGRPTSQLTIEIHTYDDV